MGENGKEFGLPNLNNVAGDLHEALSQHIHVQAIKDALTPAPSSAGQRMVDVTIDGIKDMPAGFVHSLNPHNIIPNVAMGFAIGGASKLILPENGPVALVAGGVMAAYFIGKPLVEAYSKAIDAKTMRDMHQASSLLGDTLGGMPVTMLEAGVGARLGTGVVGSLMATEAVAPLATWKATQYAKLDGVLDSGMVRARNVAYEQFGIGSPISNIQRSGIIPPYLLEQLAAKDPTNPNYLDTMAKIQELAARNRFAPRSFMNKDAVREVYDAQGQEVHPGEKARFEGEKPTGNVEVDNAYDYTGDIRDYYRDVHNRNSIDNKGMKMSSTVNYGDNFENAFWDGTQMTYGRPGSTSPFRTFVLRNVAGHEVTHGVTQFESNLIYRNQPGALNEHLSDVFGALIEQKALGQTADKASWLVGDGIWKAEIKGRALRDMKNPGTAYDDPAVGKDPQPAHMNDFIKTTRDNGGVHLNSGIPNRAFALFATEVGGNAWEGPGKIWYQARANAGSSPSFAQFAFQTVEAAKQLGYTEYVPKLQKAWTDVGITPAAQPKFSLRGIIPMFAGSNDKHDAA